MKKTDSLRRFWYNLSAKQRFIVRRIYYFPSDFLDKILFKTNKYVPSRGAIYTGSPTGSKAYLEQGNTQLELLKTHINLLPTDAVLDIGSGVGRTAIALSGYLDAKGGYEGFDVVKQGVDWCNSRLGKDFSNFNFTYVPIHNDLYNASGIETNDFKFPYKDESFDKVFSFSLFTHMQIEEIQHYFKEINRVLKPDGLCFSTFFLYDKTDENIIINKTDFSFPFKKEGYRLMSENAKSGNIAIDKNKIEEMAKAAQLEIVSIINGHWKGNSQVTDKNDFQDIAIFRKLK